MSNIKKLTPFKYFALTNFPYIEADFDALTNYELFCKIVEYVNSISTSQNEVIDAFNEFTESITSAWEEYSRDLTEEWETYSHDLTEEWETYKEYVDSIKDDLQGAVNTKLDEMALDGSLEEIIAPLMPDLINNWLDDHPEATTTVQDGSLTEAKFTNALKLKTIKDYVTPEMYGATGNGIADDTIAVQSAFNSGKIVFLEKNYLITSTLNVPNDLTVIGNTTKDPTTYNLKFSNDVKACLNFETTAIYANFENVGFMGTNYQNQALFVSGGNQKALITLNNCLISSFDCVFAGLFSLTKSINCTFYRIAVAFILGSPLSNSFSYQQHTDLLTAINNQITNAINSTNAGFGEGVFESCYISGQGASNPTCGLFVGGNPFDVKFIGCYIDYWSAIYIDTYTATAVSEPIIFNDCMLDCIITLCLTTQNSALYIPRGITILGGIFNRFNATFNSNVTVTIYDFIHKITGAYPRISDIVIKDMYYLNISTNASLASYKFINLDYTVDMNNCEIDFRTKSNINMDDIIILNHYSTSARNKFPILNYKVYDTMPKTLLINASCDSFNGHIFVYNDTVYMNVNGTAVSIGSTT